MEQALNWPGDLIYLIDDDIDGAAQSPSLPAPYREKLESFAAHHFDRLLRRADVIVASSDVLRDRLREDRRVRGNVERLDPFWALPFADQRHFEQDPRMLEIAHLGTASHGGGLTSVTKAIVSVLDRFPETRFTFFGAEGAHRELESHPCARRITPMRWRRYRDWLPRQRFHLALYPLEPTAFDRARSSNKLIEHAVVGAAGVYPRDWRPAATLENGAILAPDDPSRWEDTLSEIAAGHQGLASHAAQAAAALEPFADPDTQRRFWARMLAIPG